MIIFLNSKASLSQNAKNYMIILEYVNEGSLRQYLQANWNIKLNLAKQIANVLMFLHSNDIIHGRLNAENIHNGIIKLNASLSQIIFIFIENAKNYMIILEYVNEGSLRQYLQANWNIKLNLAKQIANVLMFLHSNDIIHGRLNAENIHNGIIKLNLFSTIVKNKSSDIFCLGIILWEIPSGNSPFEMEYLSSVNLLNNISKGKPRKFKEIYTDCLKHNGNSRPDIFQVVKNLSKIILSDAIQNENEEPQIKPDPPFFDVMTEANVLFKELFEFLVDLFNRQYREIRPILHGIGTVAGNHTMSAEKLEISLSQIRSLFALNSVVYCHDIGIAKGFQWSMKVRVNAMFSNVKAFEWFKKGCGTKKDILNDIHWLNKAKENWNIDANELLEEIISYGYLR
ncbi:hypothetical protein Glove_217g188 [Diversispora epigaea]|uniref:Protein kinase domain-containing protein n=1 Tax=Diversispora epigaea TaxID=1348612 RepID=A0A397IQ42_9GLOM|nr:hypothetical protein Glove_217g188 [Diversispora epigaea]